MNRKLLISTALILVNFLASIACFANLPINTSLAPMLQKTLPAVVNVRAIIKITDPTLLLRLQKEKEQQPGENTAKPFSDKILSVASGVIVEANKGYILTNAHVVEDAVSVVITLSDGRHYNAKTIGLDKASDVALLQIQAKNLTALELAKDNNLKVGDTVVAIGNPFGLNQTVTAGIVSALGRTTLGIENYENFIQTDASINPGNSGGALINTTGQLVGINTAILAPSRGNIGIGFAIPINMAKSIMDQLIQYGNVQRGVLGVGAQDLSPDLASILHLENREGAIITEIIPNSPAQKAGLQTNDLVTNVNGTPIKNANDLVNAIAFLRVNSNATIQLLRHNKPVTLSTVLTDPQKRKENSQQNDPFLYGLTLQHFNLLSPVHGQINGILVVDVEEDTNAWHGDLHEGDIIIAANQQRVTTIEELKKIAQNTQDSLLLNIIRGQGALLLIISKT